MESFPSLDLLGCGHSTCCKGCNMEFGLSNIQDSKDLRVLPAPHPTAMLTLCVLGLFYFSLVPHSQTAAGIVEGSAFRCSSLSCKGIVHVAGALGGHGEMRALSSCYSCGLSHCIRCRTDHHKHGDLAPAHCFDLARRHLQRYA